MITINNNKTSREVMCFMMDPTLEKTIRYVQFPQRLDGIDMNDPYANRNTVSLMFSSCQVFSRVLPGEGMAYSVGASANYTLHVTLLMLVRSSLGVVCKAFSEAIVEDLRKGGVAG
uniref:Uncharacterized protein n=1 Tax=Solanum lycopersicum TaxID=4081 RepID=A0A3Q7IET2_SOLLC